MKEIIFKPRTVSLLFLSIVVFLTFIHSIVLALFFNLDDPGVFGLVRWFDVDIENNIPSWYSSFAIFACSFLFFIIAVYAKKTLDYEKVCWFGLGFIFLFLSIDEGFKIHEYIGDLTEKFIHATGFLYFPWVVPYGFAVIVFSLAYLKFMLGLPKRTAVLFILSGSVFLTGAMVFDMLGGREAELHGYDSITYCVLYTIEEFLEMIAIVGLIYALLSYMAEKIGCLSIVLQFKCSAIQKNDR